MRHLLNDSDWLRQKYEREVLSTYQIARIVECDPKTVYSRLVRFGIVTRARGHNLKGADNYMARPGVVNPFFGRSHSGKTRAILRSRASVPKPYLRGSANGMKGRVGNRNPNYKGGCTPDRQTFYSSEEWKASAREALRRDRYCCVRCGAGKAGKKSLHLHHIKSWAEHPDLRCEVTNLVTLCDSCHNWVHSNENTGGEYLC